MSAFFLAELGDKTMLATITLSTNHNWLGVWIGSTVGMVAADALAIAIGALLGKHLPEKIIARGAAVLFFGFATWLLYEGLSDASGATIAVTLSGVVALTVVGGYYVYRVHRRLAAAQPADADPNADAETGTSSPERRVHR